MRLNTVLNISIVPNPVAPFCCAICHLTKHTRVIHDKGQIHSEIHLILIEAHRTRVWGSHMLIRAFRSKVSCSAVLISNRSPSLHPRSFVTSSNKHYSQGHLQTTFNQGDGILVIFSLFSFRLFVLPRFQFFPFWLDDIVRKKKYE